MTITMKQATEIARAAIAEANAAPEFYRISRLHDEVNAALDGLGYGPAAVLCIHGDRTIKNVAREIYVSAKRADSKYELTFWGGVSVKHKKAHPTLEAATTEAKKVLAQISNRNAHPAVIYGPGKQQVTVR
jgi:hypothetical protein